MPFSIYGCSLEYLDLKQAGDGLSMESGRVMSNPHI